MAFEAALPDAAVAAKAGLTAATVGAYADVFFDVRPRLAAPDWVARHVLGGPDDLRTDPGALWRWAGYVCGEVGFDAVRAVTTGVGRDRLPPGVAGRVERLVAVLRLPPGSPRQWFQLQLRPRADATGRPASAVRLPRVRRASPPALPHEPELGKVTAGSHNAAGRPVGRG